MTPANQLRTSVVALDRIDSLADPAVLSSILGPLSSVEREAAPGISSGYSSSRHEILAAVLRDGTRLRLRLKRTRLDQDWLARLSREEPPGREASLLGETALSPVWECFARAHLAYAVQGSEIGLLMEDHSEGLLADVREPISAAHEEALLLAIASLHARFWQSPDWTRVGAAPGTLDIDWYLAVNSTRLAGGKDELIARYRELLEARLGRALDELLWERMMDAGIVSGSRMMLWSKALALREGTPFRRDDWAWWVARLSRWSSR